MLSAATSLYHDLCSNIAVQVPADLSSCFLVGDSSGGNIAYHAALRAAAGVDNLAPLKIRGLILYKPFFSGVKRTKSEMRLENDPNFPLAAPRSRSVTTTHVRSRSVTNTLVTSRTVTNDLPGYDSSLICT
ncbi:hypothetical protein CUMW_058320 [Citrus unshiu]|nr:hypothetical protein CUMW_058320 [Citrus unshiu]